MIKPYSHFRILDIDGGYGQVADALIRHKHKVTQSPKISTELENIFRSMGLTEKFGSPVILKLVREEFHSKES